jgi:quinol monooxygenase YgiN
VIIVTGNIRARADSIDEILRHSLEHVQRSRLEPGCLLHSVHRDVEDPLNVVFIEHWRDRDALNAHFAVPASGQFVNAVSGLASEPPNINIFEAERA